jgi:hypothetical protein
MSSLSVSKDGFTIASEIAQDAIEVKLSGSCDSQTKALLEGFLADLHAETVRLRAKNVALDCESLYFMNSASVKSFVMWLTKIKTLGPVERYRVAVRTNRHLAWQQRSFGAISRSAPDVLTIAQ